MGGRDQIDAGRALRDQLLIDLPQARRVQRLSHAPLGDVLVLAEAAPQAASGEKDAARAVGAHKARLLPLVEHGLGRHGAQGLAADAARSRLRPLRAAVSGAETADHSGFT